MLDVAVADDLTTLFYAEPANVSRSALREIIDYDRFRAEMSRPRFEDWVVHDGA